jgi:hypothetical protein
MFVNHLLKKLFSNAEKITNMVYRPNKHSIQGCMNDMILVNSPVPFLIGAGKAGCWISFDILMEKAMDGRKALCPIAAFEKLAGASSGTVLFLFYFIF